MTAIDRWTTVAISFVVTIAMMPIIATAGSWIFAGHLADKRGQHRVAKA